MSIAELRKEYHTNVCKEIVRISGKTPDRQYPNFADGSNRGSVQSAWGIVKRLGCLVEHGRISGQTAGKRFERLTRGYLEKAFARLHHIRPGEWVYFIEKEISAFAQYEHLATLVALVKESPELESSVGVNYIVTPDIVIGRRPISEQELNLHGELVRAPERYARLTPLRESNSPAPCPLLHASISCKWTLRSDRAQNARAEAYNLVRDRKGNLPHVVAVTAEPQPTRIAALALGTGDLDCVYHFALYELQESIEEAQNQDQLEMLQTLVDGRRLRDISDLPFDLAT